jgi:hypothetical protein
LIEIKENLIGQKFGKLTALERVEDYIHPTRNFRCAQWLCQCDCGSEPIIVKRNLLSGGNTKSCGCLQSKKKLPDDDVIIDLYVNQHKTCKEISIMYGLTPSSNSVSKILKRNGVEVQKHPSGPNSAAWKGGRIIKGAGYYGIWNPTHERADNQGYVYEHTLVYEANTGRLPQDGEVIHHIDLDKLNNDFSNLFICGNKEHLICHRSIEKLIKPLMQNNIIYFENGEYKISEECLNKITTTIQN